jgi:hypothetical protein
VPTLIRHTGFEWVNLSTIVSTGGGLCSLVSGTPSLVTSPIDPMGGAQAIECVCASNTGKQLQMGSAIATTLVMSCRVNLGVVPGAAFDTYKLLSCLGADNGSSGAFLGVDTSNGMWSLLASVAGGTLYSSGVAASADGLWHTLDLRVNATANPWVIDWAIDGVAQTQRTTALASGSLTAYTGSYNHGTTSATTRIDNFAQSTTSGDYPLGPIVSEGIYADQSAAAEHVATLAGWDYTDNFSTFTAISTTNETDSRSRVNDLDQTDGVRAGIAAMTGNLRWPLADPVLRGTPLAVTAIAGVRESGTGVNNATLRTYLSGSTTNLFTGDPGWGTTWNYLRNIMTTKPGGGAWTITDVDALRFEMVSTDGNPAAWLGGFVLEVATVGVSGTTYTKAGYGKENG